MATLSDHFRSQILRCTTVGHPFFAFIEKVGPAEVSKFDCILCIEQDILWLDVSVDDGWVLRMQVLDSLDNFANELSCYSFVESAFSLEACVNLAFWGKF